MAAREAVWVEWIPMRAVSHLQSLPVCSAENMRGNVLGSAGSKQFEVPLGWRAAVCHRSGQFRCGRYRRDLSGLYRRFTDLGEDHRSCGIVASSLHKLSLCRDGGHIYRSRSLGPGIGLACGRCCGSCYKRLFVGGR